MKLAEALILRADLNTRIGNLNGRLVNNAKVQEGDAPAENPAELLTELERTLAEFTAIVQRINRTNSITPFDEGLTLSDALAVRDTLQRQQGIYQGLANSALITHNRYSQSEVRFKSTVDVAAIQKQADSIARQHRDLDARIQALNWSVDLVE